MSRHGTLHRNQTDTVAMCGYRLERYPEMLFGDPVDCKSCIKVINYNYDKERGFRVCDVCAVEKPFAMFETLGRKCSDCKNKLALPLKRENYEQSKVAKKQYLQTERGKEVMRKANLKARDKFRDKEAARYAVSRALKKCELVKPDHCTYDGCNTSPIQAHHYLGYEPEHHLDIQWLCKMHHWDAHKFSIRSKAVPTEVIQAELLNVVTFKQSCTSIDCPERNGGECTA